MPSELIFTSAPKGLRSGSFGYCTVARHESMSDNLVSELEKLSGFDLPPGIEKVESIYSFFALERPTGKYWILSRKRACDRPDYSGRGNYIAHHLVFSQKEVDYFCTKGKAVTPESILLTNDWRDEFEGEPEIFVSNDEAQLEAIWCAAQKVSHSYVQFLQENHAKHSIDSSLYDENLEPKAYYILSSDLCTDKGSRKILRLAHQAKLLTSPWLGEYCGENLFDCSAFPIDPHTWWDTGITTMLVYNDNASRYRWIGTTDQRVGSGNRSRFVIDFDHASSDPQEPNILSRFALDPETYINEPERIRAERFEQAANYRIRELITIKLNGLDQWAIKYTKRNSALIELANAKNRLDSDMLLFRQRLNKLIVDEGETTSAQLRQKLNLPGLVLNADSLKNANFLEEQLKQLPAARQKYESALTSFNSVNQECINSSNVLENAFAEIATDVQHEADSLSNGEIFRSQLEPDIEQLHQKYANSFPTLETPIKEYSPLESKDKIIEDVILLLALIAKTQAKERVAMKERAKRLTLTRKTRNDDTKIFVVIVVSVLIIGLSVVLYFFRGTIFPTYFGTPSSAGKVTDVKDSAKKTPNNNSKAAKPEPVKASGVNTSPTYVKPILAVPENQKD